MRHLALLAGLALAGPAVGEPVNAALSGAGPVLPAQSGPRVASRHAVGAVRIALAPHLRPQGAESLFPSTDIPGKAAWSDPKAQVATVFAAAAEQATQGMVTGEDVVLDLLVTRFDMAGGLDRATIGQGHDLRFDLTIRDAGTGAVLDGPIPIVADGPALRGGITGHAAPVQRVWVTAAVTDAVRRALSRPVDPVVPADRLPIVIAQDD